MKKEMKISIILLLVNMFLTIGVRIYLVNFTEWSLNAHGNVYKIIKSNFESFNYDEVGITFLYLYIIKFCGMFWNSLDEIIIILNTLFQIVSIMLLFFSFKRIINVYSAFAASIVFSLWPWYSGKIFEVSYFNIRHMVRCLIIYIFSLMYIFIKKTSKIDKGDYNMTQQTNNSGEMNNVVTPLGMKELKYEVNYIENPLPVPKRRDHKAMDYAIDLLDANDDYDIKDMSGMDFFDIE